MRKLMAIAAVMLVAVGAANAAPASTNIAVWYGTPTSPTTFIDGAGRMVAPYFIGDGTLLSGLTLIDDMLANQTSGNSYYRWLLNPDASATSATYTRYDMLHLGSEANAASTNAPIAGAYISVGRAAVPAGAGFSGGTFDTALRTVAVNRATNNAAYGLRGAYIKAKNYTSGTVGGLEGLFVEAVGDGTEDNGEAIGIKIGTDNSIIDIGIDMDLMTADVADIQFQNGAKVLNSDANTLTITEAAVNVDGGLHVGGTSAAGDNNLIVDGTSLLTGNSVMSGTLNVAGAATFSNSIAAASVAPANGFTTNIVIVSKDDKTNTFTFTSGVLTAFTLGE